MNYKQIVSLFFTMSCFVFCSKKQYICPAYTTYFIHDQKERDKVFMPFIVDSLNESTSAIDPNDSTSFKNNKTGESSKFQLNTTNSKDKLVKKYQINGLVISSKIGKSKPRNVSEIEMKVISIKGTALFSGIDSTSLLPKNDSIANEFSPADTIRK